MVAPTYTLPPSPPAVVRHEDGAFTARQSVLDAVLRGARIVLHARGENGASAKKPAASAAAGQSPDRLEVPRVDDDTQVSPIELVSIPASEVHRDASGRPIPSNDRIRVVVSPYVVSFEKPRLKGGGGTHAVISGAVPNPLSPRIADLEDVARPRAPIPLKPLDPSRTPVVGRVTTAGASGPGGFPGWASFEAPSQRRMPDAAAEDAAPWIAFSAGREILQSLDRYLGRRLPMQITIDAHGVDQTGMPLEAAYFPERRLVLLGGHEAVAPNGSRVLWILAGSAEAVKHELAGHAAFREIKPRSWSFAGPAPLNPAVPIVVETLGDQGAFSSSLERDERRERLLAEMKGNPFAKNALAVVGEGSAAVDGTGKTRTAIGTGPLTPERLQPGREHDGAEILDQALYPVFVEAWKRATLNGATTSEGMRDAGAMMGRLLFHATYYLPENNFTFDDFVRALIRADQQLHRGVNVPHLLAELGRRGFITLDEGKYRIVEPELPAFAPLVGERTSSNVGRWLESNAGLLELPPGFSLGLDAVVRLDDGWTFIRTELRFEGKPLYNHGNLFVSPDGDLASYHSAFPTGLDAREAIDQILRLREKGLPPGSVIILWRNPKHECQAVVSRVLPDEPLAPGPVPRHSLEGTVHDAGNVLPQLKAQGKDR